MSDTIVPVPHQRLWRMGLIFLLCMYGLQWAWGLARGSSIERIVIEQATVGTTAALIQCVDPELHVVPQGARLLAPGGGLNVYNGCEGTELLFLLVAALLAYPFSWRWRLTGLGAGLLFVFVLNQVRLLLLFYSFRTDRQLFAQLHGLVAPLLLMALTLAFVAWLIRQDARTRAKPEDAPGP